MAFTNENPGGGGEMTTTLVVKFRNTRSKKEAYVTFTSVWSSNVQETRSRIQYTGSNNSVELSIGGKEGEPPEMNYIPDARGRFMGQSSSTYQLMKMMLDASKEINLGASRAEDFNDVLCSASSTVGLHVA